MAIKLKNKGEKDLFEHEQHLTIETQVRRKKNFILPRLKKTLAVPYENVILLAIAFIMVSVIFFSLGVKKGRQDEVRIRRQDRPGRMDNAGRGVNEADSAKHLVKAKKNATAYTIQIAAFRERRSAEEERERLRKEGYKAGVKKTGTYYQVYAGFFRDRKKANIRLEKLKKSYSDCYIKKIGED